MADPIRLRPSTRAGLVGRILLWVIGIPLLIILFAIAALTRGIFRGDRAPDAIDEHHAQPPAIYQPKGPDAQPAERPAHGIER
jgi:hypothetical protein